VSALDTRRTDRQFSLLFRLIADNHAEIKRYALWIKLTTVEKFTGSLADAFDEPGAAAGHKI